jgi:HK97 family phage portal protein
LGLLDFFRRKALTASPAVLEAAQNGRLNLYQRLGGVNQEINAQYMLTQASTYAWLYEHQPSVRKVVDYIARNVAQLGLKLFERVDDADRQPAFDHPAALTMAHPNAYGPADDWIRNYVSDFLIYENAYALKYRGGKDGALILIRVPPPSIVILGAGMYTVDAYRVFVANGQHFDVPPSDIIHWRGYNPCDERIGISRLETLRTLLAEDAASQAASAELYKAGLAKPGYIIRPLEAPEMSEPARQRFLESWANMNKSAPRKTPMLEEGMEFADFGISPKDAEMLAGREFTNQEVASLYGLTNVPAETDEERRAFYADVLPPITESLAEQLDFSLVQFEYGRDDLYFEFNITEKLRGALEDRAQAITASVGAPWLTRNEARALENLPPVDGGDDLITPLNVVAGDNPRPAPNVMPPQDPNEPPQDGSYREAALPAPPRKALALPRHNAIATRRNGYADAGSVILVRNYNRQERAFKSAWNGKAVDAARWDKFDAELAADLEAWISKSVEREGDINAARFGNGFFDMRQVRNYLAAQATGAAEGINGATRADLTSGLEPEDVFRRAKDQRAGAASMTLATAATAFAASEAAKQTPDAHQRTNTWIVTSANSAHPEMDGETVALGATFSNGTEGPPADHPGCECCMEIS